MQGRLLPNHRYNNALLRTSLVAMYPNINPAPLGLSAQPAISSGSDHTRSQYAPCVIHTSVYYYATIRRWTLVHDRLAVDSMGHNIGRLYTASADLVRNFLQSFNNLNLIYSAKNRWQTAMHTEDSIVNQLFVRDGSSPSLLQRLQTANKMLTAAKFK